MTLTRQRQRRSAFHSIGAASPESPVLPVAGGPAPADRLGRVRSGLVVAVIVLAAAVAALAYLVSFEAISAYVARIGALPAWLRWCGPLLVDTFITLGTLFLLWLALSGIPLRRVWDAWYAWALIATATGASAYLNAAHAPPRWDARAGCRRRPPGPVGQCPPAGPVAAAGAGLDPTAHRQRH